MRLLIAGPVSEGQAGLGRAARALGARGHVPIVPSLLVPPLADATDREALETMTLSLAERCDAVLRIGGDCDIADHAVMLIKAMGGQIFWSADEAPEA